MAAPPIVELRIHGVGGGSARQMLGDGVEEIGDASGDLAGFWRHPEPVGDPPRIRHVYSWGGFSARNATRALWVLLLPFTLVNMAGWMVDPSAGPRLAAWQRALVRLVAAVQTVLLMLWIATVAFDVFHTQPLGRRLALAGAVAALVLVVIAIATVRSSRYEEFGLSSGESDVEAPADDDLGLADPEFWRTAPVIEAMRRGELALAAATVAFVPAFSMWKVTEQAWSLAFFGAAVLVALVAVALGLARATGPAASRLAVAAALLVVASLVDAWLADLPEPSTLLDGMWTAAPLWLVLAGGLVLVLSFAVECLAWRRRGGDAVVRTSGLTAGRLRLLPLGVALGLAVLVVAQTDGTITPSGFWQYVAGSLLFAVPAAIVILLSRRTAAEVLAAVTAGATLLLVAAVNGFWWLGVALATAAFMVTAFAETGRRDRFRWLPVSTVATFSVVLLAATGSGLSWIVDRWWGSPSPLPTGYSWVTAAFAGALVAAGVGSVFYLLYRRVEAWPQQRVTKEYVGVAEPCRTRMSTKAGRRRSVSDVVGAVDVVITVATWITGTVLLVGVLRTGRPALDLWSPDRLHVALTSNPVATPWAWLAAVGAVLAAALPVVAVGLLVAALRFAAIRSKVGVVWDVGTFWPRRFHPLAPPAYAERSIPELVGYVTDLEAGGSGVVVVGHSQGSVLTLATALQLGAVEPHRLAALTHGSPIGRYYRRFWPAQFGGGVAAGVASTWSLEGGGERWWNAFRLTDPIGGPLFTGPDERVGEPDTDLCLPDPRPALTGCPDAKGHLGYLSDPDVRATLDRLGAAVGGDRPPVPSDDDGSEDLLVSRPRPGRVRR